ncbi:GntR family transcriptional regulator [Rhodoplanes sp. TEM]|uniref:GntR family transcriptional regulator n=1 Tax=Rhodoplanes tepidamans TaxID=200616 RepID=A0ABT5JF55_RHOTP|nr:MULTISPECIES: GntR family transcriptional regulator [Rhodoplanes]MDC7787685.1 GntR family transcriptional regulator [Rhodoplanes tepidamans]MDC7983059.1 GntR family transcriptional regulator [Rhodoplanes sp. TEM]MDQ0356441.1 DNA-binding GntR family transcriptional regulator [Rhodoplanes tepidamans]
MPAAKDDRPPEPEAGPAAAGAAGPGLARPGLDRAALERGALPLGEAVFRALCGALRDGVYRPGDRIVEDEVAQKLEVSRTPVREALGRLLAKGLVEHAGGRGMVVRRPDAAEVLELYAMREILEGAAARLAAGQASAPEIDTLAELAESFATADDARKMARLNRLLHEAIVRAARNRFLDGALREMQDAIALLGPTTFNVAGRPATAVAEHAAIVAAIAARDADAAEQAARAHIREALRARLKLMQGAG